jgi:uncharacterized protein with NRDE domain
MFSVEHVDGEPGAAVDHLGLRRQDPQARIGVSDVGRHAAGIDLERERALSSPFIPIHRLPNGSIYGTRASTLVRVSKGQSVQWLERTFKADGSHADRSESFQIQSLGAPS